ESVLLAPHDKRRRGDPREPAFQAELGYRKQKLRRGSKAARYREQYFCLFVGAVIPITKKLSHCKKPLSCGATRIVKQVRHQLSNRQAEHINDREIVSPKPDWSG